MMSGRRRNLERAFQAQRLATNGCPLVSFTLYVCVCVVVTQDEGESGEDDEDDDGFFVPHGYLSDGEGEISDGEVVQYFC